MTETIKKVVSSQWSVVSCRLKFNYVLKVNSNGNQQRTTDNGLNSQSGMSMLAILAVMTIFAISLLAVAPSVMQSVQREKELEAIRRGEEIADAIRLYVEFYQGNKLPDSMDELLEGLPAGTKKRMILRPSAAIDPLSPDGKWRLVKPDSQAFLNFGRRVQSYNNGVLPSSPSQALDRFALPLVNVISTKSESDSNESDEAEYDDVTEGVSFIGVVSGSRSSSVIAYYGIENHSKWVFTPLFRGSGVSRTTINNQRPTSNTKTTTR